MRYAVIEDGIVVNIVISDADFAAQQGWVADDGNAQIGGTYDGAFHPAPVEQGTE